MEWKLNSGTYQDKKLLHHSTINICTIIINNFQKKNAYRNYLLILFLEPKWALSQ